MSTFLVSIILLVLGYLVYGLIVEKVFGADKNRETPAYSHRDGVDYMPLPTWKVFLIQFLNIAGTGPIFGAIQGILFGPSAYIWIVIGCIFGGAVHDYMTSMISIRYGGVSIQEIVGKQMGNVARVFMLVLSLALLVLVGAVFVDSPARLLTNLTEGWFDKDLLMIFWLFVIFTYYILATLLPIDKIIGRFYPIFGFALLIMALGLLGGIFFADGSLPEITTAFENHHPAENPMPIIPGLCITIACGAVSGFHATQSPVMARCLKNEKMGRPVFYGAMITEGLVALIWAAATIKFADSLSDGGDTPYQKLICAMTDPDTHKINPALLVNKVCNSWMGTAGAILAILGVVAAPITSGDTALRSARLILADFLKIKQNKIVKRLMLSIPVFLLTIVVMSIDFQQLWRYFGWTNQTLATVALWTITIYLARNKAWKAVVSLVPALWMTFICGSYIVVAPEGFQASPETGYFVGCIITAVVFSAFLIWIKRNKNSQNKLPI